MRFLIFAVALHFFQTAGLRAEWAELPWPQLGAVLPVWKPDDFDPTKKYPAIVYYHGTGEQPNVSLLHKMTGGSDFVLVGMTYRHPENETNEQVIADEIGLLEALKKTLVKSLSVDANRIHVGGFSRGGWHAAMLLDRDRTLAGGLILGGAVAEKRTSVPKFASRVPVYIGCGRYDGNYPPALGALVYFRSLGADVTLETWPEVGHTHPEKPPEAMRQWLRIQAQGNGLQAEAEKWIGKRLTEIEAMTDPVERWFCYDEFSGLPFVRKYGEEAAAAVMTDVAVLLGDPAVAKEKKWRDESRRILARESGDRLLTTLQAASKAHEQLATQAMGTRAGAEAIRDTERTRELLKTAKIVTRPSAPAPAPITPEINPSAPTGNPDRGPFFPPGIKVKPAK